MVLCVMVTWRMISLRWRRLHSLMMAQSCVRSAIITRIRRSDRIDDMAPDVDAVGGHAVGGARRWRGYLLIVGR